MHLPRPLLAFALAATLLANVGRAQPTHATWTGATSSNWNDGTNWNPMNIPNGSADTATFNASSGTANVTIAGTAISLNNLYFTNDALASTLTVNVNSRLTFSGGIHNSSAFTQSFVNNYDLVFGNFTNASAGSGVAITNNHYLNFNNGSNAGAAAIANTNGSNLSFTGGSSAGSAAIINDGSMSFSNSATADEAAITNNGTLSFGFSTTAGSAAITNSGTITFSNSATGGSAAVTNSVSGTIDFTNGPSEQSLGSLAGGGTVLTSYGTLTVGSLNTSTTFSGVIDDGGNGVALTKAGTGTLRLTGSSNYYGLTTVAAGTLLVNGASGTTLGSSYEVDVASGATLGGTGLIGFGDVYIMDGGHLAPGDTGPGTLSINSNLYLQNGAILDFRLGTVSDRINTGLISGTLYGPGTPGGITVNLTDSGGFGANTYILIDFTGGYASIDPTDFQLGTTIAGYDYSFVLNGSTLELIATASAIPEPSTYAALLGLAALGLVIRRRRLAPVKPGRA